VKESHLISEETRPQGGARAASDAFWLVITAYLGQALTLVLAFILRKELGPEGMGYVALTQLLGTYAPYASLGVFQAAEREIAVAIGRRDENEAASLEGTSASVAVVGGLIGGFVLVGLALAQPPDKHLMAAALLCCAAVLFCQQFSIWATVRLRTRMRFVALGWASAAAGVAGSVLAVIGAVVGGASGALLGVGGGAVFQLLLLAAVSGIRPPALRRRGMLRRLAGLAPGFLAVGAAAMVIGSIDQLAVGFFLGTAGLGLYSGAYLGYSFVIRIPNLIASVIYPRLQRELGASADIEKVFAMTTRTTTAVAIAMPGLVAVFFLVLPNLAWILLPEFRSAVMPMRMLLVGIMGFAFGIPAIQFLVTINRQWLEVALTALFLAGMAATYAVAARMGGMSITVAAAVDLVGYYAYGIVMQGVAARKAGQPPRAMVSLLPVHLITAAELLIVAWLTDGLVQGGSALGLVASVLIQGVAFAATWFSLMAICLRTNAEARADANMFIGLLRYGLKRLRSGRLRSGGAT
jgi:O-antigen/teichoic acid export membrane protein